MNLFRLVGDLSHLLAIIILIAKIWRSRSCAGIKVIIITFENNRNHDMTAMLILCRYIWEESTFVCSGFHDKVSRSLH